MICILIFVLFCFFFVHVHSFILCYFLIQEAASVSVHDALLFVDVQQNNKNNETIGVIESAFLTSLKKFETQYKRNINSLEEKISSLERENSRLREQINVLKYGAGDADVQVCLFFRNGSYNRFKR